MQVKSDIHQLSGVYPLSGWFKLDPTCISCLVCIHCPADAIYIHPVSIIQLMQVRSNMYLLSGWCKLDPACISCPACISRLMQVRSNMYQLSSWCKLDLACISCLACISSQTDASYIHCPTDASYIWHVSVFQLMQVRSSMYQLYGIISCLADTS